MKQVELSIKNNICNDYFISNKVHRLMSHFDGNVIWYNIVGHDWNGMSDTKQVMDAEELMVRKTLCIPEEVQLCWVPFVDYIEILNTNIGHDSVDTRADKFKAFTFGNNKKYADRRKITSPLGRRRMSV